MNIHEHQAKQILKEFGAPVSEGVVVFSLNEIDEKLSKLNKGEYVLKAQIHAGGRGKAGGVKLVKDKDQLFSEAKKMMGKTLVTHQTGPDGKEVKRLYIEEASKILNEFYLSCLVDRETSSIAFISSTEGGMDIEKVAKENPEKIITKKIDYKKDGPSDNEINEIISIFKLKEKQQEEARKLIKILYKILLEKDASLIEINPLVINKEEKLVCLDAKMNFDDNAIFRRPEILKLRDLNEEEPAEIEASKYDLAYIKLNGSIGCMVNGAGLAMATMDIIKLHGQEPANFLDVGG
ncbi:MAG: ADP-forming succinate--CoA ligase subunit beta, partial [Candidatus Pelagibacter sp. TMED286]